MKKTYNITMKVTVDVKQGEGKRIPWFSFRAWKYGKVSVKNRFIDTEPIVKRTKGNMEYIGEAIFTAVKDMAREDGIFLSED